MRNFSSCIVTTYYSTITEHITTAPHSLSRVNHHQTATWPPRWSLSDGRAYQMVFEQYRQTKWAIHRATNTFSRPLGSGSWKTLARYNRLTYTHLTLYQLDSPVGKVRGLPQVPRKGDPSIISSMATAEVGSAQRSSFTITSNTCTSTVFRVRTSPACASIAAKIIGPKLKMAVRAVRQPQRHVLRSNTCTHRQQSFNSSCKCQQSAYHSLTPTRSLPQALCRLLL